MVTKNYHKLLSLWEKTNKVKKKKKICERPSFIILLLCLKSPSEISERLDSYLKKLCGIGVEMKD